MSWVLARGAIATSVSTTPLSPSIGIREHVLLEPVIDRLAVDRDVEQGAGPAR